MVSSVNNNFNPTKVIGSKVQLEIIANCNLKFPEGIIVKLLQTDFEKIHKSLRHIFYLIELENEISFIPPKYSNDNYALFGFGLSNKIIQFPRLRKSKNKKRGINKIISTKYIIVEIRRVEAIEEELNGITTSEGRAPILYFPKNIEILNKREINLSDLSGLGPGTIKIMNKT